MDALLPVLYLKGISTSDFQEAVSAIMGPDAPNLSPAAISRLTTGCQAQYDIWADGVYLQARMEDNAECMLVIIDATPEDKKERIGFPVGRRESAQSWHELLTGSKARGLSAAPQIAVDDGAMGFWNARDRSFPGTKHQRCWVHKVKNVQGYFPKQMGPAVKTDWGNIQHAATRAEAEAALVVFNKKYSVNYPKGVACLTKDEEAMPAFFDLPAEDWGHLRTSNPIESVFATVRHRTGRTKGALSHRTAKLMVCTAYPSGSKEMVAPQRQKPVAKSHRRNQVHRRYRTEQRYRKPRRLMMPVTQIQAKLRQYLHRTGVAVAETGGRLSA